MRACLENEKQLNSIEFLGDFFILGKKMGRGCLIELDGVPHALNYTC